MRCSVFLALLFSLSLSVFAQTPTGRFQIRWDTNDSSVAVVGSIPPDLQNAAPERLAELFPVAIEPANVLAAIDLPSIVGTYATTSNTLTFRPRFPFDPGMTYRASFVPGKISSTLTVPRRSEARNTRVSEVFPTTDQIPQNLLKFYLHFSAPMSRGHIYENIHLLDEHGRAVELPFLEIDEELWNPEMTRLTLFLDPGRIKRGVRPLEEVGPALYPDKDYTLVIDEDWTDARGVPLKESFRKKFHVTPPDREPPDPVNWKVVAPKAATREPLVIRFTDPMDQALALRMIAVKSIRGQTSLRAHENEWLFTPDQPWKAGRYEIQVQSTIEDLAGNNIGKPFEVDLQESDRPREPARTISLSFDVN